jgi:two-component system sensor histidine kinase KdpD
MPERVQDFLKTVIVLSLASVFAYYAKSIGEATDVISVTYILVVVLISRMTNGYMWGILASVFGVLSANFIFTAPYFQFNFTLTGYPFTFCVMLIASIIISTLTQKYKQQKEEAEDMARKLQESYRKQIQIERATEKEKMKNNLLRAISHDLRTPLTSIKGAAAAIHEGEDSLDLRTRNKLLEDIGSESEWLIRMVENLLSVTHISEETMKVTKVPESAEEVIAAAVSHFHSPALSQTITVRVPDELIVVPMDAMLIQQVLLNLLDNACKHSGNSTKIEVSLAREDGNAVFTVRDDGRGISEEDLPNLFEYGESKNKTETVDTNRGFGIGLPTCKTIIMAHEGKLWAENNPGRGSSFHFSLPLE